RSPGKETEKVKVIIKDMVLEKLLDAFAGLLARQEARGKEKEEPKKIVKDRFTVAEKIVSIRGYAREHKRFPFDELFSPDMTKSEMINVFLALLELLKLQNVRVEQTGIFQQINVISNED
ncbi:MAG: segregation/condensation protein A, partial [Clostridia bacterium]|nr:segregation/condensation protein A [Clostridia bacterium]